MARILVADDDPKLLKMLRRTLTYEGFDVLTATDGQAAVQMAYEAKPDAIILDWLMPEMDGLGVLQVLRAEHNEFPILMLTARDAVEDRVEGLDQGADDYLIKPFAPAELVARVNALLRRAHSDAGETLCCADLNLDPASHQVWRGSRNVSLTPTEFELLRFLMRHAGQVLSRSQIINHVWGLDFAGDENVLEVYIGYLRKKTEAEGEPRLIQTVRGVGYVLREEE